MNITMTKIVALTEK